MGRLIDADKLEKELFNTPLWDNEDEEEFYELINKQPTAYDIDKVVEQLEEEKNKEANDSLELSLLGKRERAKEHSYGALCLEDAIKIVKKGGSE